jgi:hypothetical protein
MRRAWVIALLLAIASVTGARANDRAFEVHLIEPAEHVDLVAGSTASIAWEATNAPANVDEWEAFLSVNGGRTYPIRLTPHLDLAIRRFTWTVPFLPGAEASLLLRFGDERDEREFAFPARMQIKGSMPLDLFRYEIVTGSASTRSREDDHGEELVEWVEGSSDGSRLHRVFSSEPLLAGRDERAGSRDHGSTPAASNDSKRLDPASLEALGMRDSFTRARRLEVQASRLHFVDVLGLTGRLNI